MSTQTKINRKTILDIKKMKTQGEKIAMLTAYDFGMASVLDESDIDILLVGDSLGNVVLGYDTTLPVTMEDMIHHTRAVARGSVKALIVADMPFLSYHLSLAQALENAGRFIQEAGADAVKIEGGTLRAPVVQHLNQNGIPVLGHIGLTPQHLKTLGGYKVQGRQTHELRSLIADAKALEKAGAFAVVLECLPPAAGRTLTKSVSIPTVGCGAGPHCDGQMLVTADILGLTSSMPRFAKKYAEIGADMQRAITKYQKDVQTRRFPGPEHCY